jgi:hypothetical protein
VSSSNHADPVKPKDPKGVRWMNDVTEVRVEWLWHGWIALGKVNLIGGDPGLGKSTVALDIAARTTTGRQMPSGGATTPPANVLIISAEDDLSDTIVPRLRAAGAELEKVASLALRNDETGEALPFSVPEDIDRLDRTIRETDARFVVIDPIAAFLSEKIQSHNDASVRKAMAPLTQIAQETGAALLLVRHLNKSGGGKAIYRGGGSIAFTGAARSEMLAAEDPEEDTRRVLAQVKGNLSRGRTPSLAWRVESWEPEPHIPVIRWLGPSTLSADELLSTPDGRKEAPARKEVEEWLKEELADGPKSATDLALAATERGFSERTVKRARSSLTVAERIRDDNGKTVGWKVRLRG